ncbi:MAG: thymidine phosphorylase [Ruminococcus sp.]|nr:thymidine phosphorylase [Ruminococcus sp.]
MNSCDIINKTKRKTPLSYEEIQWFINEYTNGNIPDYQVSAWLMAVCLNSLTDEETFALTDVMKKSGDILDLSAVSGITVDKHSTGGVGDKTSLIIGPIAAACGVYVPKMSGRGLGHTGGTIDKLESISGYRTDIPFEEFISIVNRTGFSIVSQSGKLCPADKKLYALRNATGTVDSIPLICASIMSKKLAMNADCILLDVKYGSGAFMKTIEDARKLADIMTRIGTMAGKKCSAIATDMNIPLGKNIGNALEVAEAVEILQGRTKGRLYDLCIELSAEMLRLAGKGDTEKCRQLAENAVSDGKALEIFAETIELQGGDSRITEDISRLPQPLYSHKVCASKSGKIIGMDSEEVGMTSLMLGAGRAVKSADIDMSAGIVLERECGDTVQNGEHILTLYSSSVSDFSEAEARILKAITIE